MTFSPRRETAAILEVVGDALALAGGGAGAVHLKVGRDVVTDTDYAVEDLIRTRVTDELGLSVVGEERGGTVSGESHLLVDPICGTRNFASGIPLFSVNVALVEAGEVTASVVGDGSTGARYVAERDRGAYATGDGTFEPLAASDASRVIDLDGWPEAGPPRDRAARLFAEFAAGDEWDVRSFATTLGLGYLASGRIAAHVLFSTPALHVAAGVLLAREAGATVTDLDGAPWCIDSDSVLASAAQALHSELLDRIRLVEG